MSSEQYIVLRSSRAMTPEPGVLATPGFTPTAVEPETVELVETDLTRTEREDLRRDPRTKALARSMPMKLIEPTDEQDATAAAGSTWGVDAVGATQSTFDGTDIVVAVLDTGIDPQHDAFQGVTLVQKNFTTEGDDDSHGHGTHCAGTIFGRDVSGTRIGVARGVDKAVIGKVLGAGGNSSATIAQAIQWAVAEGAHVISMSLGIDFPGFVDFLVNTNGLDVNPATSIALEQYRANVNLFSALADMVRAQGAFGQGTIIVAASGNESRRPQFEIAVAPPAAGTGVIAVGALAEGNNGHEVASFSNTQVDVSGPGVDVVSARVGGGLRSMSGTSMATPHAAGVAALWAQSLVQTAGRVDSSALIAKLVGRAETTPLAAGFEVEDVGSGIVQAP